MSASINIASYLPRMAQQQPQTLAVAFPLGRDGAGKQRYLRWTYAQLEEESNTIARGLQAIGIQRGMRTVLMVKPSPEFFALVFAIFKIGAVLIGVDPGMGVKNLKTCLGEAEPEAFIGIRKAHIARKLLGWGKATNRINVLVGRKLLPFGATISLDEVRQRGLPASLPTSPAVLADTQPQEIAAILFTSGSTGIPKGVVYTHANFDAQVRALREQYNIEPGEIDLCTFPLFALYAPALGMSAIVPQMDFTKPGSVEPRDIFEPVSEFKVTTMFGSPALLKRITQESPKAHALPCMGTSMDSLKRVISAGAPVPSRTIAAITQLLTPGTQVFTPYGATESLPVCSIGSDEILRDTAALTDQGKGVCIGKAVASIDLRIIRISDEPIDKWANDLEETSCEIGEICVRGPQVTRSYFNREASTKLAKIDCDDGTFFHRMGDLGYRDETGRIWFCGRKAHRVVTADRVYYSIPCESIFNTHSLVPRSALVRIEVQGIIKPSICIECPDRLRISFPQFTQDLLALAQQYEHTRSISDFFFYLKSFPVDIRHNAKINREALSKWAQRKVR